MSDRKLCYAAGCHRPLPPKKRKFCSSRCYERINAQKKRARKKGIEWTQEDDTLDIPSQKPNVASRRGQVYEDIKHSGLAEQIYAKQINLTEVAKILGTTTAAVSMAYQTYLQDLKTEQAAENWELPQVAEETLKDFDAFRERYFRTEQGVPFETPEFHGKWIENIMNAIDTG